MESTSSVFYGVSLEHDERLDDDVYAQHGIDPDEYDAEKLLMEKLGYGDLNVHKGGYEMNRISFYTRRVAWAYDYGTATLDPIDLIVTDSETESLREFCEAAGIENPEPRWILTADT